MRSRVPSRQPTGLYVHSSPPTGVPVHDSVVRQWLRGGEMSRLKELVLEGEGAGLVGEYSPDVTARAFLRVLPRILSRIDEAHTAVSEGDLERTERAVRRERTVRIELSKDQAGLSLLHKAVIRGHRPIQEWLLASFPELVHLTDRERRSALHYAGSSAEPEETWRRLTAAGSDPGLVDSSGFSPAYYMHHPRRARPPQPRDSRVKPDRGLVVKPANIRIWIHDRDLGRLQKVVWEGFGQKLLTETSSQPKVRRFLSAVPYILMSERDMSDGARCLSGFIKYWYLKEDGPTGSIRDIHKAAIENDVETLQKRTADPVPKDILLSKDVNGLNPLHKAAGLGQKEAVMAILAVAPESANAQEALGRTPLHYAAALKDSQLYETLVEAGAVDHLQDKKGNTPSYYRSRPGELEGGKLLSYVPEAPRTAHIFPPSWDWRLLQSRTGRRQASSEAISKDSTTEDLSKVENMEESKPEVSEDEGVGSENAQSVDDTASPQNSENIDMEPEDERSDKLDRTVTLSRSELFGEDSGAIDVEADLPPDPLQNDDKLDDDQRVDASQEANANDGLGNYVKPIESDDANDLKKSDETDEATVLSNGPNDENDTSNNENNVPINENDTPNNENNVPSNENDTSNNVTSNENDELNHENDVPINENDTPNSGNDPSNIDKDLPNNEKEAAIDLSKTQTLLKAQTESGTVLDAEHKASVEEATVPPLVRSGTIVLEPESINNLSENSTAGEENATLQNEQNTNEANEQEEQETRADENHDDVKNEGDNLTHISSTKSQQSSTENTQPETEQRHNSATKNKVSSSRRSLKSRALKAIELGRGQVELFESAENMKNISDKQSTIDNPEVHEENTPKNQSESNMTTKKDNGGDDNTEIDENQHSRLQNDENSTENPRSGSSSEKEGNENISRELDEEYFPDSLEDAPGAIDKLDQNATDKESDSKRDDVSTDRNINQENNEEEGTPALSHEVHIASIEDQGERRSEAEQLVTSADMEGMAEMVLSGEGEALLDLTSDNPDVQLFINNVPQYMAKIEKVHKASREGDLRGVQTSLDRRKFAVARDNGTSLKPTPLHVAVLFGRTSVLRYLAGRFPETMHAQDSAGRTPLHYSTTLPDNGHFYSLLITLGADKAILDSDGKTAEYYLRNKDMLTREMLLAEYQDRPVPIDMSGLNFNRYSDKVEEDSVSARHDVDEEVLLEQMERCYRLILHRAPGSDLGQILHRDLFEELRLYYTCLDNTLLDILRPVGRDLGLGTNRLLTDPNFCGVTIPDSQSFRVFSKLIVPLIQEISGLSSLANPSESDFTGNESDPYFNIDIDPGGVVVKSCVVEIARNLSIVPFAKNLKLSELEKVEVALSAVLTNYYKRNKEAAFVDEAGENLGSYYSLGEVLENKELFQDLKEENLLVEGVEHGNWPYGRGVFISPYGDVTAWVNLHEHIHLLSVTPAEKRGHIGPAYKTAVEIIALLEEKVECVRDSTLGLLATDLGLVGNCLRLHVLVSLPHVGEDLVALRKLAGLKGLLVEANPAPSLFRIRNRSCQGSSEIQTFKTFVTAISEIVEMEKASSKMTVTQIPHLIKNFLRKKSSKNLLSDLNK